MKLFKKKAAQQPDGNPNFLAPEPQGKFPNRRVSACVGVVAIILVAVFLAPSSPTVPKGGETGPQTVSGLRAEEPSTLVTSLQEAVGVAVPKAKAAEPAPNSDNNKLQLGGDPPDRAAEAKAREEDERRRRAFAKAQEAHSAPMLVKREDRVATVAPAQAEARNATAEALPSGPSEGYDVAAAKDRETFFQRADQAQWVSPYTREPGRPFELKTGAVIPATLAGGINSDLPGSVMGQVSQDVYDTATGRHLLIPQGSKLYGVYDSRVAYGQRRVLIAWNRVIFPDGSSVTLGAMPGADAGGYGGFQDGVDNHYFRVFGSAVLMSLITGATAYAADRGNNDSGDDGPTTLHDEMVSALASQIGQVALQLLQKNLSISPTLTIRPGYRFNVAVTKDIVFKEPYGRAR